MSEAGPAVEAVEHNPVLCTVIVVEEYVPTDASMQEELHLAKGQIISILSKDPADSRNDKRFWAGRVRVRVKGVGGRIGLVYKASVRPYTERPGASAAENSAAKSELQQHARECGLAEIEDETLARKECVGAGGFGRVFRAEWEGRNVAVKELNVTSIEVEARNIKVRELLDEGGVIARCSHRNICQIYGVVVDPERFCLVLEFCQGGTLARGLQDMMLSPETIADWATQVAKGMAYLHDDNHRSVVHRDLKSNNVLLSLPPLVAGEGEEGEDAAGPQTVGNVLKISDFGLARDFSQTTKMTQEGTIAWMAPEVIRTGRYSKASDVFSYGVVLWELLTSQVPYHKIHYLTVAYTVAMKGCTLPVPSDCPALFKDLMTSCWENGGERPAFSAIVATLAKESPAFADTSPDEWTASTYPTDPTGSLVNSRTLMGCATACPQRAFAATQTGWRAEMAPLFEKLVLSEEEVNKQRSELERIKARHEEQERKETELAKRERELADREQKMHQREVAQVMNEQIMSPPAVDSNGTSSPVGATSSPVTGYFGHHTNGSSTGNNGNNSSGGGGGGGSSLSMRSRAATFTKKLILQRSSSNSDGNSSTVTKKGLSIDSTPLGFKHVVHCSSVGVSRSIAGLVDSPVLARSKDIARPELPATFIENWRCCRCGAANRLDQIGCLGCSAIRSLPNSPSSPNANTNGPSSPAPTLSPRDPRVAVVDGDEKATKGFRVRSATAAAVSGSNANNNNNNNGGGGGGAVTPPQSMSKSPKPRAHSSTDSAYSSAGQQMFVLAGDVPARRSTTGTSSPFLSPFSSPFSKRTSKKKPPPKADPAWLKPSWSKKDAVKAMVGKPVGTFVVRSSASRPGSFAISVVHKQSTALDQMHVWHGLILRSETEPIRYRLGTVKGGIFASLVELVTHFQKIPYTFDEGRPCILVSNSPRKLKLKRNSKLQLTTVPPDHTPPRSGDKVIPGGGSGGGGGGGGGGGPRFTFSRSRSPPSSSSSSSSQRAAVITASPAQPGQSLAAMPIRRARAMSSPPDPNPNASLHRRQTSPEIPSPPHSPFEAEA